MAHYSHLSQDERNTIGAELKTGKNIRHISGIVARSPTTSIEIRRNKGWRGYRPKQATEMPSERKDQNQSWFCAK